jgi:alkanesulfonate monooxygenase SsuD/methylene tetrahydromethanopterin reductase-like flavin-dependent oxidoreductase (luciferase family)
VKIGVVLPVGEMEETGQPLPYLEVRSLAMQAEEAGFDSIWLPDHLLFRFPDQAPFGIWECWSLLTALAEATERVELGTLVLAVPFRNPALLAKMAITTDAIANGRLILGLGAGWHLPEFEAFGIPQQRLVDQFEEGLQIITPLLREGRVDFRGTYFSAPDCEMRPRGPRPGGPPVLIASRRPRMLRLTAQYADQWNWAWSGRPAVFLERHAELVQACHAVGRDPATLAVTVGIYALYPEHLSPSERDTLPATFTDPDRSLRGSPDEIAAGLAVYEGLPAEHLICHPIPNTVATHAELTKALRVLRR